MRYRPESHLERVCWTSPTPFPLSLAVAVDSPCSILSFIPHYICRASLTVQADASSQPAQNTPGAAASVQVPLQMPLGLLKSALGAGTGLLMLGAVAFVL